MQNANLHTKYRSAKNIMINRIERQEIGTKNPGRLHDTLFIEISQHRRELKGSSRWSYFKVQVNIRAQSQVYVMKKMDALNVR